MLFAGEWIAKESFSFIENRRGNLHLAYKGYVYSLERKNHTTNNWVCIRNRTKKCPSRCSTAYDRSIKFWKKPHNHGPVYDPTCQNAKEIIQINWLACVFGHENSVVFCIFLKCSRSVSFTSLQLHLSLTIFIQFLFLFEFF